MNRAKILVIEGTDGSGKQTQSDGLYNYLIGNGYKVKKYSFPMYDTPTGRIIGGPYLGKEEYGESYFPETAANVDPIVSILYYAADRRNNFLNEIENEIYQNDLIILDRYIESNMGHQGGKAKTKELRDRLVEFIKELEYVWCELPKPDEVIFLHMPPEASKELRKNRTSTDGLEGNDEHLRQAEKHYLDLANQFNWHYVNCLKSNEYKSIDDIKTPEEISKDVITIALDLIKREDVPEIRKLTRF